MHLLINSMNLFHRLHRLTNQVIPINIHINLIYNFIFSPYSKILNTVLNKNMQKGKILVLFLILQRKCSLFFYFSYYLWVFHKYSLSDWVMLFNFQLSRRFFLKFQSRKDIEFSQMLFLNILKFSYNFHFLLCSYDDYSDLYMCIL